MNSKDRVLHWVKRYMDEQENLFVPGETYVRSSGVDWDYLDVESIVETVLSLNYADGKVSYEFERFLANAVKQRHAVLCNSGSSANLLALSSLTSKTLGARALQKGDEVITVAAGFPTTVNPIIQNGLVPVFVDTSLPSYNPLPHAIEEAVTDKTKAIIIAHTLGNPFKAEPIRRIADRNELWLISDCCDALGSEYLNQPLPFYADLSTFSFYPAHHISLVEGGAVVTNNSMLNKIIRSFRDWGRDCWCAPGKDNTCGKRYEWCLGELPKGFDHKYIYSEVGYNLKNTDLLASLGVSQIKKLPRFTDARRRNWEFYREYFSDLEEFFILPEPTMHSNPSWFGFMLSVKESAPFSRNDVVQFLENNKIGSRMLFGGNLTKHPAYENVEYRVSGTLHKSDFVMENGFWIGVSPVVTPRMSEYVVEKFSQFMRRV
jgi:CDP-6-deoxy-D-xylo-4-hexulose-3-dehydrase